MAISFVNKIIKANELMEKQNLLQVDFGGIISGYYGRKIEFIENNQLYEIALSNNDCRKPITELAELIVHKIKHEKVET